MVNSAVEQARKRVDELIVKAYEDTSGYSSESVEQLNAAIEQYAQMCAEAELQFAKATNSLFV